MTKSQTAKYWREWAKVRKLLLDLGEFSKEDADQERHEIHIRALGQDKSSKALTNRDLDAIFDHFESYLVLLAGPQSGPSRADSQPVKRLLWAIDQLGLPAPYIEAISHDQFGTQEWRKLTAEQLTKLRFTLAARARHKAAKSGVSE
jgi:hypothetical protein